MRRSLGTLSAVVAGTALMLAAVAPPANAILNANEITCFKKLAGYAGKFVKTKMKDIQKCTEKNLATPGTCPDATLTTQIGAATTKFQTSLDASVCATLVPFNFAEMGFPGKCSDPDPSNGFTYSDLKACLVDSHENIVDGNDATPASPPRGGLIDVEYGTKTGPITDSGVLKCQKTITKNGAKFLSAKLKAVQKCRTDLQAGKLTGFAPGNCATAEPTTAGKISTAETKARAAILGKCTDAQVAMLDVCSGVTTETAAENCIIQTHGDAADSPNPSITSLIDFEFATQPVCGDNVVNTLDEECDGTDDSACPSQCGAPNSGFGCLCLTKKRERVIEHSNSDLDNGWTGQAHDQGIVEGGGYVEDIYDCDGVSGPDTLCTVGPSCSGGTHTACTKDSDCGIFGPCRKERTAVGPHCNLNVQRVCSSNADCGDCVAGANAGGACTTGSACPGSTCSIPGVGDFCHTTVHGSPLPLAAGQVSVCVSNVFTEDVVGTTDLSTGSSSIRLRQTSFTYLENNIPMPCPVCGGFCDTCGTNSVTGCSTQIICSSNADCPMGVPCVLENICSRDANYGKECRPNFPFGGASELFGSTSVDCPPTGTIIGTIDILFNPTTTGTTTKTPNSHCTAPGFGGKTCVGGSNQGASCTVASECPSGSCNDQCFCPAVGGTPEAPNQCNAACVHGPNDANLCSVNSECPGGFCHQGDCRPAGCVGGANDGFVCSVPSECPGGTCYVDPGNEGVCATGPSDQHCSLHTFKGCTVDADCKPTTHCLAGPNVNAACTTASECPSSSCSVGCAYCLGAETCVVKQRECFVNSGITKTGIADPDNPESVAAFCETATSSAATNNTAGLPGPAAIRQPTHILRTALP